MTQTDPLQMPDDELIAWFEEAMKRKGEAIRRRRANAHEAIDPDLENAVADTSERVVADTGRAIDHFQAGVTNRTHLNGFIDTYRTYFNPNSRPDDHGI